MYPLQLIGLKSQMLLCPIKTFNTHLSNDYVISPLLSVLRSNTAALTVSTGGRHALYIQYLFCCVFFFKLCVYYVFIL